MGERIDYKLFRDSNSHRAKYRSIGTISLNLVQEERRKREKGRFHKEEHKGIASIVTDRTESWYT